MNNQFKYLKYKLKYLKLKKDYQIGGNIFFWPNENIDYSNLIGRKIKFLEIEFLPYDESFNSNMINLKDAECYIKEITDTKLIIYDVYSYINNVQKLWLNDYDIDLNNFRILRIKIQIVDNENIINKRLEKIEGQINNIEQELQNFQ